MDMKESTPPQPQTIWPAQEPVEPTASTEAAPAPVEATPTVMQPMATAIPGMQAPTGQFIQGQPMMMAGGPQQVVYVPLKFSPQPNYRTWSYIAIGLAFVGAFLGILIGDILGQPDLGEALNSLLCCGGFTAAIFLDVAYYKGKADWQTANGMSNTGSTLSMVLEGIIGVICAVIVVFGFIGMVSGL